MVMEIVGMGRALCGARLTPIDGGLQALDASLHSGRFKKGHQGECKRAGRARQNDPKKKRVDRICPDRAETSPLSRSPAGLQFALLMTAALAGCESADEPAVPVEPEVAVAVHDLSPDDPRVNDCIARFPRSRFDLGEGVDETSVVSACTSRFGPSDICDTSTWVSLEAATCVAQMAQLSQAHDWRAQLRVSHTFPPRVYWRIRLSEGQERDDQRNVDARSGGLLWRF